MDAPQVQPTQPPTQVSASVPVTPEEQQSIENSKSTAQEAITELQKIINLDTNNKDMNAIKKEITVAKAESKKKIDAIMKPKGMFGIFGFGGSKKKAKKGRKSRKTQKK